MNEFFKKPVVKILMLKGEKGDKGNTGTGTPKGGKTGQYLLKKSNADYDFAWSPITTVSWDNVSGKTNATGSASGLMSADDKAKLDNLQAYSDATTSTHGLMSASDKLKLDGIAAGATKNVSIVKSFTLSASSWSSGSYTISDSLITESSNQEVMPAVGITLDQLKALQTAMLVDGGQSTGKLTLKAMGTAPTIDIPIRIIFGVGGTVTTVTSCPFPIGSIYLSVTDASPSETFPGTAWQSIGSGRVLQGADDANPAGETIEAGIPNIKGNFPLYSGNFSPTAELRPGFCIANETMTEVPGGFPLDASDFSPVYGRSDTVQPPALAVYMWQRIA